MDAFGILIDIECTMYVVREIGKHAIVQFVFAIYS